LILLNISDDINQKESILLQVLIMTELQDHDRRKIRGCLGSSIITNLASVFFLFHLSAVAAFTGPSHHRQRRAIWYSPRYSQRSTPTFSPRVTRTTMPLSNLSMIEFGGSSFDVATASSDIDSMSNDIFGPVFAGGIAMYVSCQCIQCLSVSLCSFSRFVLSFFLRIIAT